MVRSIILQIFDISYWVLASPIPHPQHGHIASITYMALPNSFCSELFKKEGKMPRRKEVRKEKQEAAQKEHTNERLSYSSVVMLALLQLYFFILLLSTDLHF